jgi:hypothetical protein
MNEDELRDGLRHAIATSEVPPPMSPEAAVDAGRAAHRRRRTTVAAVGAAAAVVAIAVGATLVLPGGGQDATAGGQAPTPTAPATDTKPVMPTGTDGSPQSDRTAVSGPRLAAGVQVLEGLVDAVPAGYEVPTVTPPQPSGDPSTYTPDIDPWSRTSQSQFMDRVGGVEVWEYLGSLMVSQGPADGRLVAQVLTPGNDVPHDLCTYRLWNSDPAGCRPVAVTGGTAVVVDGGPGADIDQWAAVRHADGTVVVIGQGRQFPGTSQPLPQLVFTAQQLAELTVDPRFHVE